jgi:HAD superfamily phosphoserine phosphatase-like hydrolase
MIMEDRIAIFDFCKTCVPFQTGDRFLIKVIKEHGKFPASIVAEMISNRLVHRGVGHFHGGGFSRNLLLKLTKGIHKDKIESIARGYGRFLDEAFNWTMREIIRQCREDNMKVFIISGGYEEYIKKVFVGDISGVVLASKIRYNSGKSEGCVDGAFCLGEEKVRRLKEVYKKNYCRSTSVVYSDCLTDLPLFGLVDKKRWLVKIWNWDKCSVNIKKI